jgi:hypothetical protein
MTGGRKKESASERAVRLAEALRANLHRRKSQSRQRKSDRVSEKKDQEPQTER